MITASTPHKLSVTVLDYDRWSANDFMGKIHFPVAALFTAGPGTHDVWVPLVGSKKHRGCEVKGDIRLHVVSTALPVE